MSQLEPEPQTITAVYDGQVLRPEAPLDLKPHARYRVTITPVAEDNQDSTGDNLWDLLDRLAGTVEMPPDWSAEHDHYLYGTPRRQHGSDTESSVTLQTQEASRLFERAMAWLQDNYGRYRFFAERDIVWTVQTYISKVIAEQGLPLRIFNDHRMLPGKRADLAIVDSRKVVLVAVEVKYEPSPKRSGDDISPRKFPVVFWTGDGSVAKDVERVRRDGIGQSGLFGVHR